MKDLGFLKILRIFVWLIFGIVGIFSINDKLVMLVSFFVCLFFDFIYQDFRIQFIKKYIRDYMNNEKEFDSEYKNSLDCIHRIMDIVNYRIVFTEEDKDFLNRLKQFIGGN